MKKILAAILCITSLLTMLVMTACTADNGKAGRTVIDMQGNTIVLPEKVEKYTTVYSSAVPMLAMLDEDMAHCVMYPKSSWFEYWEFAMFDGIADHAQRVNKREVTAEQIIASGTEVFFWNKASHQELVNSLTAVGIACVNVQVNTTADLLKALEIITEVLDTDYARNQLKKYKARFSQYEEYVKEQVKLIPTAERKSVLVLGNVDTLVGYGANTYSYAWATLTGLNYILPSNDGANEVTLNMEQIYQFAPDVIVANGIFDVPTTYADPTWSVLRATQNNLLLSNPSVLDFWSMPTTEAPLQYIWALNKFYPQYAGTLKLEEEIISFYKEFYAYEMSAADVQAIVNGTHFLIGK